MKKINIILIAVLMICSIKTFAQDSTKTKLKPYASIGLSIGHVDPNDESINNFNKASFPSLEFGIMGENVSAGLVFGYENLMVSSDTRAFYELKTSVSKSLGKTSIYGLFGVGAYGEKGFNNFIEYGAGFCYMPNSFGYFVQYSNWARTNYVSVGLTKTF